MTQSEFHGLPYLLGRRQTERALGYDRRTLMKMVDAGVLRGIRPEGCCHYRFQKRQVAILAGIEMETARQELRRAPLLVPAKTVMAWTGYAAHTLDRIVEAGGLTMVRTANSSAGKYRKVEIMMLIGLGE